MLAVFDTNVLLSTAVATRGTLADLRQAWEQNAFRVACSDPILEELARVLWYPKLRKLHKWSPAKIQHYVRSLRTQTVMVPGRTPIHRITADPSDNMILACAVESDADVIVSGDMHLQAIKTFNDIPIVTPKTFVEHFVALRRTA